MPDQDRSTERAKTIDAQQDADPGSLEALGTYLLNMLNGTTALTDLQNDRYPDLGTETYRQHVARTWGSAT